ASTRSPARKLVTSQRSPLHPKWHRMIGRVPGYSANATDEEFPVTRCGSGARADCVEEIRNALLGLSLAGVLAVTVPIAAHANERRSNTGPTNAGPVPNIAM